MRRVDFYLRILEQDRQGSLKSTGAGAVGPLVLVCGGSDLPVREHIVCGGGLGVQKASKEEE